MLYFAIFSANSFLLFLILLPFHTFQVESIARSKAEKAIAAQTPSIAETKNKQQQQQNTSNNGVSDQQQQHSKVALTNNSTKTIAENGFAATTTTVNTVDKTRQSELLKVMEMPTPTPMQAPATAAGASVAPTPKSAPKPNPITSNSRRRKSISTLVANHTPAKAMLISNRGRRDTMIETCPKIREHQPPEPLRRIVNEPSLAFQHKKSTATNNIARTISQKLEPPAASSTTVFATKASLPPPQAQPQLPPPPPPSTSQKKVHMPNNDDVQIIEAFDNNLLNSIRQAKQNVTTIKGTRNVMNAISQGAQLVKVIDSKIIKHPVTISNMYVTAPTKPNPAPIQVQQSSQQHAIKPIADAGRLTKFVGSKGAKVEIIALPPPSARNPNIVKTSDKIMHVSPHLQKSNQIIRTAVAPIAGSSITSNINSQNHHSTATATTTTVPKFQQKNHVVQVVQSQPRMVTIHPNSGILTGK